MRPVTKATKKQMPSHAPTRAATRGWRRRDGKSRCSGIGGVLSAVIAAAPTSTPTQRSPTSCVSCAKPAAVATEGIASAPTTDHGNGSEVSPPALSRIAPGVQARAGWRQVGDDPTAGREQLGACGAAGAPGRPRCRGCRRRAARSPSGPRPAPARRRCAGSPRRPGRGSARSPRAPRRSRARSRRARRAAAVIRPGPQPTSSVGPVQRSSTAASPSRVPVHASAGTSSRVTSGPAITHGWPRKTLANTASTEASTSDTDPPPELGEGRARWRTTAATASASSTTSTSRSTGPRPTVRPATSNAARVAAPVVGVDIGTPTRCSPRRGSASASAHQPPSSASASTASWSPSPSMTAVRSASVTCGVSMQICTTGPGRSAARSRCENASRSASPSPRCGKTVQPASAAASRSAYTAVGQVALEGEPAAGRRRPWRRRYARVSSSAAAASSAAPSMPTSAPRRVFAWPGDGRLGTTRTRATLGRAHEQHPREVAGGPQRAASPSRTPSSGCPRRAGGR